MLRHATFGSGFPNLGSTAFYRPRTLGYIAPHQDKTLKKQQVVLERTHQVRRLVMLNKERLNRMKLKFCYIYFVLFPCRAIGAPDLKGVIRITLNMHF